MRCPVLHSSTSIHVCAHNDYTRVTVVKSSIRLNVKVSHQKSSTSSGHKPNLEASRESQLCQPSSLMLNLLYISLSCCLFCLKHKCSQGEDNGRRLVEQVTFEASNMVVQVVQYIDFSFKESPLLVRRIRYPNDASNRLLFYSWTQLENYLWLRRRQRDNSD